MPITQEELEIARATFTEDTDRDIRDLAFIEVLAVTGSRYIARDLKWEDVRVDECAIVLEVHEFSYDRVTFEQKEWREEKARYPLSNEALQALKRLSDRIDERCFEYGIQRRKEAFLSIDRYHHKFDGRREYVHGGSYKLLNFYHMSGSEPKEIIDRIEDARIKQDVRASQIQQEIARLESQINTLKLELREILQPVTPDNPREQRRELRQFQHTIWHEGDYINSSKVKRLWEHGIRSIEQLQSVTDEELLAIKGIGKKATQEIREVICKITEKRSQTK